MDRKSAADTKLEQRTARVLSGTAQFKAPQSLEARVLKSIERRMKGPWWQRRVPEWPHLAQALFLVTGVAAAAALLLARPATPKAVGMVIGSPAALLRRPTADLHAALDVLVVLHRVADTMAGSLTNDVWYGGLALCAASYVALFLLIALGYRLLQMPVSR